MKALHPASDLSSPGIPDQNEVDLFRTELRATLTHDAQGIAANWDCLIWCPPGDNTVAIVATGLSGVNFKTASMTTGVPTADKVHVTRYKYTDNVAGGLFSADLSGWAGVEDGPDDVFGAPGSRFFATTYGQLLPKRWRTTASSLTVNLIANATQNQGTVYCWEGGRGFSDGVAYEVIDGPPVLTGATHQPGTSQWHTTGAQTDIEYNRASGVHVGERVSPFDDDNIHEVLQTRVTSVPFDETDMFIQTPHLYATNAYNGAYCVHRFSGPDQPLQNTSDAPHVICSPVEGKLGHGEDGQWNADVHWNLGRFLGQVGTGGGVTAYEQWSTPQLNVAPLNIVSADLILPGPTPWPSGLSAPPWLSQFLQSIDNPDTSFDNVTQSVTIFRGLDPAATLQLKRLTSIEAAPLETSPARPFVTPPINYEPRAIALYYEIAHRLESVHPADYNDFSTIIHKIAEVVKAIAAPVTAVASVLAPEFAPEIAAVGGGVTAAADLVANMTRKQKAAARQVLAPPQARPTRPQLATLRPAPKRPAPKRRPRQRMLIRV